MKHVSPDGDEKNAGQRPRGEIIASAESGKEEILTARVSLKNVRAAKVVNDVAGHYARPDLMRLVVDEPEHDLLHHGVENDCRPVNYSLRRDKPEMGNVSAAAGPEVETFNPKQGKEVV